VVNNKICGEALKASFFIAKIVIDTKRYL